MEQQQLILPKVMSANTNNQDQHIIDYIQFNAEQINYFDECERLNAIHHKIWIIEYLKNFPVELDYIEPPV